MITGCFGFTRGGYAYGEIQQFIHHRHNIDGLPKSVTYTYDGLMIAPYHLIDEYVASYQAAVISILGNQAIQQKKTYMTTT
jgi:hypothetical protein